MPELPPVERFWDSEAKKCQELEGLEDVSTLRAKGRVTVKSTQIQPDNRSQLLEMACVRE
jgi:hypothetical protein